MDTTVVAGVESTGRDGAPATVALEIRLLGPLRVTAQGRALPLPASRKVRALIAYLALSPRPVARARLRELLWDGPSDPRGELRWTLSKMRAVLDEPGHPRVLGTTDTVALDLTDGFIDALAVAGAITDGIEHLPVDRLERVASLFGGDFLEGLELERSPQFGGWLVAQRRRFRAIHASVLEHRVRAVPDDSDAVLLRLEQWIELCPFDPRPHELLLQGLTERARLAEAEEHLAATARLFENEGLDWHPIRDAWRQARTRRRSLATAAPATTAIDTIAPPDRGVPGAMRRASVVVMPFSDQSRGPELRATWADGLAHDVVTRLAKLRSMFVIAHATARTLHERGLGPEQVARILDVDYAVGGTVRRVHDSRAVIDVELTETRTARVVWAERFARKLDDTFLVLDEIGDRIVASIASEIETVERNRAILKAPASLDAWEAYHRGLWHMYRFSRADNDRARHFFAMAVRLDPTFARAYAGLSFTHFQDAFQHWTAREQAVAAAFEAAGQSLMVDGRDPAAHWAMGRALWLHGRQEDSLAALEKAVDLSPNFALGHYTLAFVHSQSGDPEVAIAASDRSRALSPYDPLMFGMLASRAMALVRLERFDDAAEWALRAAGRPNAHAHILMIAAACAALAGRVDEARGVGTRMRQAFPEYAAAELFDAFRFAPDAARQFQGAIERIGVR